MASLRFPCLSRNQISAPSLHSQLVPLLPGSLGTLEFKFPIVSETRARIRNQKWKVPRAQAVDEDYELKQMRDMASARKRWEALVREGKIKAMSPREAGYAIQLSNKTLLDVRPETERKKAWVKGSIWMPIFDNDSNLDIGALSRKATNFMMGGWWSGAPTLSYNRSLAACELLCNVGYENVFWVQGGLEAAEEEDLPREGPEPFKFAGIGGLSEFLGWTDQQRLAAAKEGWQYRLIYSARTIGLIVAADGLFIAIQQAGRYIQELRSH
ncbi:hypothetical protein V2J09_011954 [Rumex salicifolius]